MPYVHETIGWVSAGIYGYEIWTYGPKKRYQNLPKESVKEFGEGIAAVFHCGCTWFRDARNDNGALMTGLCSSVDKTLTFH